MRSLLLALFVIIPSYLYYLFSADLKSEFATAILFSFIGGMSTMIGGFLAITMAPTTRYFALANGIAAGVMIIVSIFDMIIKSCEEIGVEKVFVWLFVGFGSYLILSDILPQGQPQEGRSASNWFITFFVVTAHNLPEGLAVAFTTYIDSQKRGMLMMLAICIHNIPEGLLVAATAYEKFKDRRKALYYTFLSSLAEPIGAILAVTLFHPYLSKAFVDSTLAAVAGIMLMVSFVDLFPSGFSLDAKQFKRGLVIGGSMMGFSIYMLH